METMEYDEMLSKEPAKEIESSLYDIILGKNKPVKTFSSKLLKDDKFVSEFKKSEIYLKYKLQRWEDERRIIIKILSYLDDLPEDHELLTRLDKLNLYITLANERILYVEE